KGPTPTLPEDGEGEGRFFPPRLRGGWPSASEAGWGSANAVRGAVGKAPPRPSPKTGREKDGFSLPVFGEGGRAQARPGGVQQTRCAVPWEKAPPRPSPKTGREKERSYPPRRRGGRRSVLTLPEDGEGEGAFLPSPKTGREKER